ncbi:hypothetical protein [Myxosarcina sp. GI1]|uniref:hypothetical protein n=1 Tax=Myxosarcina sp. GI1 TaxID=1541065 RepID=UPI00056A3420|nr:hypothetical protein [Myxosarcina sp. GI1]
MKLIQATDTKTAELKAIITTTNCGSCPYAIPTRISQVFYECSLFGGLVKAEYPPCGAIQHSQN